jgi:ABC-2 type transport system ATP-binding protein
MAEALVEVKGLEVRYGKFTAVKGIDLHIERGWVYGFIGPNGAGKSSTIRVLATLMKPAKGRVTVCGHDVVQDPAAVRRSIGFMPDSLGVYEDLSVHDFLSSFAAAYGIHGRQRNATIRDVLELVDLTKKEWAQVDSLSRGMKQRLGLARVLLHDPDLLLLDEPASGLDPRARIELRELLKELQRLGKTILISSHILHELAQLCSSVGILEAGKLVAHGDLDDILASIGLGRTVHIQVADAPHDLLPRLAAVPGVEQVEEEVDRLALHLTENVGPVEDLHQALVEQGLRLRMFQPAAIDMETAFMKLTTGTTA